MLVKYCMENNKIVMNCEFLLIEVLVLVVVLMVLLVYNIFFKDGVWLGDYFNYFILLMLGVLVVVVGFFNKMFVSIMV